MKNILLFVIFLLVSVSAIAQTPCDEDFDCDEVHKHVTDCDFVEDFYGNLPCGFIIEPLTYETNFEEGVIFHDENNVIGSGATLQELLQANSNDIDNEGNDYSFDEDVYKKILSLVDQGIGGDFRNLLECVNFNCLNFYLGDVLIEFSGRARLYKFINDPTEDELAYRNELLDEIIEGNEDINTREEAIAFLNLEYFGPDVDLDIIIRQELGIQPRIETTESICCFNVNASSPPDPNDYPYNNDCLDNSFEWTIVEHYVQTPYPDPLTHYTICSRWSGQKEVYDRPDCEDIGNIGSGSGSNESQTNLFSDQILGFEGISAPNPAAYQMGADNISAGVNLYNGLAQSDISITSISNRDLEIPIGLSYQSAGLEIDAYGSDIGSLWQLNNGYSISRQVNGLPDEFYGTITGKGFGPQEAIGICVALDGVGLAYPIETGVDKDWHIKSASPESITLGINIPIGVFITLVINITIKLQVQMKPQKITYEEKGIGYLNIANETKLINFVLGSNYHDLTNFNANSGLGNVYRKNFLENMSTGADLNDFTYLNINVGRYISLLKGIKNAFSRGVTVKTRRIDTEPDEFYISIPEFSGKFVMDQQGNIFTIPHSDLIIDKKIDLNNGIVEFTVHTTDSKLYTFGQADLEGVETQKAVQYDLYNHFNYYDTRSYPISLDKVFQRFSRADLDESFTNMLFPFMCLPCAFPYKKSYENNYKITDGPKYTSKWHLLKVESKMTLDDISFEYEKFEDLEYFVNQGFSVSFPNFKEANSSDEEHKFTGMAGDIIQTVLNPFSEEPYIYTGGVNSLTYSATRMVHTKYKTSKIISSNSNHELWFDYEYDNPEIHEDKLLKKITHKIDNQTNRAWQFNYDVKGESQSTEIECLGPVASGQVNFSLADEFKYQMNDVYVNNQYVSNLHNFLLSISIKNVKLFFPLPVDLLFKNKARNRYIKTIKERGSIYQIMAYIDPVNRAKELNIWKGEFKRAYLKEIIEIGRDQSEESFVKLTYFYEDAAGELPKKFSPRKDLWGYFNNSPEETGYFPEFKYKDFNSQEVEYENGTLGGAFHLGLAHDFTTNQFSTLPPRIMEADLEKNKIMALKRVQFKTGAFYEFDYELHDWKDEITSDLIKGAGLRVKKLIQGTVDHSNPNKTVEYKYNIQPEEGPMVDYGALMVNYPKFVSSNPYNITKLESSVGYPMEKYITVNSSPLNTWYKNKGHFVGYKKVVEIFLANGSVEHSFTTVEDHPPIVFEKQVLWRDQRNMVNPLTLIRQIIDGVSSDGNYTDEFIEPNMPMIIKDWRWGLPVERITRNEQEEILSKEEIVYDFFAAKFHKQWDCRSEPKEADNEITPIIPILKNQQFKLYYPSNQVNNRIKRTITQSLKFPETPLNKDLELLQFLKDILFHVTVNIASVAFDEQFRFIRKYDIYSYGEYVLEYTKIRNSITEFTFDDGKKSALEEIYTYGDPISVQIDEGTYNYNICHLPKFKYLHTKNSTYFGESGPDIQIKDNYYYSFNQGGGTFLRTNTGSIIDLRKRSFNGPLRVEKLLDDQLIDGKITCYHKVGDRMLLDQNWSCVDKVFVLSNLVESWDDEGRPAKIKRANFDKKQTTSHDAANTQHTFLPAVDLTWDDKDYILLTKTITSTDGTMDESYEYTDFKELKKKTDIHGQIHEFEYDEFGRLLNSSNNNSLVQKSYEYTFIPNTVKETTEFGGNIATPTQESTSYFDGFGKVEKIVRSDAAVLQFNKYDSMFRLKESESLGGGNTIIEYQANPLNRKMSEVDAEDNLTQYEYLGGDSEYPTSFSSSLITDANGHESKIIQDGIGRNLASISGEGNKTKFFYDDQGRIDKILNPENQEFLYAYNGMGTVETKLVPNSATETSYYNERMQVIAVDDGINGFLYEYDDLLRLINVYFVKGGIMLSVNNSTGVADNAGYLSAIAAAGDPIQEFEFNATTHLLIRNKENILFDDKTTFYKETILGYDGFLRVNHESVSYPDEMISVIYEHQYNGASMPVNSLIDYDGTKYRTATDYDNLLRLSVMNHAHDKVQGVRAKIELNYNEKDQLKNKNLGFTIGQNYSILQTVDFEYDLIGRLLEINDIEENECNYDYLEEETCYLEYDELLCITEEGVSNPCSIPGGSGNENNFDFFDFYVIRNIEINGVVHPIDVYKNPPPSSGQNPFNFYLLAQNVNELREFLQQFIEDLGFSGEVQIRRSQVSGQPYMRRFRIVVANGNINSLKLLSDHCEFELELDCCEPDPDPPMAQALALSTTNPDLYAQKITYNYLDIQQIDYFSGCLTGIITNIYEYDADHRLKKTDNRIILGPHQLNGLMDESYLYDKAGNITYLNRKGIIGWDYNSLPISSEIDILNYNYSNDKELNSVIDAKPGTFGVRSGTTNYSYDARGNITSSSNSNGGYAITYNPLNLPYEITGDDGTEEIWYTAGAEKFKIISPLPQNLKRTRIYLRNLELELHEEEYRPVAYNHSDGRLFFSFQPTIFTDPLGTQYQFQITDHLGNIMVQFEDRDYDGVLGEDDGLPSSDILVRNHYYSFGMLQENTWQGIAPGGRALLRYKYNGKELHKGSRLLDYGFRYYDPGIGRFTGVDPLAGDYPSLSPYAYVANNPLKYIDPDGRKIVNPYERYSQYSGLEQRLRSNVTNASNRSERRMAKRELKANRSNIQGFNNYQEVQGLLSNFKQANESEYNRVDNLQLNGVEIDVVVGLNNNYKGDKGQVGETNYSYGSDPETFKQIIEFQTGDSYLLPTKIENNNIDVTLYSGGRNLNTLANEFGDAIFGVENPAASYRDTKANVPYLQKSSTQFSFDYEDFIIKGGAKPDPKEY